MTSDPAYAILRRYLNGEIDLGEAAAALMSATGGPAGFSIALDELEPAQQEQVEALMGRLLWLTLREQDPNAATAKPWDADGWRAMCQEMERHADGGEEGT